MFIKTLLRRPSQTWDQRRTALSNPCGSTQGRGRRGPCFPVSPAANKNRQNSFRKWLALKLSPCQQLVCALGITLGFMTNALSTRFFLADTMLVCLPLLPKSHQKEQGKRCGCWDTTCTCWRTQATAASFCGDGSWEIWVSFPLCLSLHSRLYIKSLSHRDLSTDPSQREGLFIPVLPIQHRRLSVQLKPL